MPKRPIKDDTSHIIGSWGGSDFAEGDPFVVPARVYGPYDAEQTPGRRLRASRATRMRGRKDVPVTLPTVSIQESEEDG